MSGIKQFLRKVYYWPILPPQRVEYYQWLIREAEWDNIKQFIPQGSKFLDVGCGTGYNMLAAKEQLRCEVTGIDPEPGKHGVGRFSDTHNFGFAIIKGEAENLPFPDHSFDVVFSSHVLEHVRDPQKVLSEINRIVKNDGAIIIGVPTGTMAWIRFISMVLFTTHIRVANVLLSPWLNTGKSKWWSMFIPFSHSHPNKTIFYDLYHYRTSKWNGLLTGKLIIQEKRFPLLYPYPDFRQLFRSRKFKKISSSVYFICNKL